MPILNSVESSLIEQHFTLKAITEKLGLSMRLSPSGWLVQDPYERSMLMTRQQLPKEAGALEDKLRRVFLSQLNLN